MDFSEAVRNVMDKTGTKRSDIAKATGYSHQYISDLIAGERRWNEESINKVCEALGIKIEISSEKDEVNPREPII